MDTDLIDMEPIQLDTFLPYRLSVLAAIVGSGIAGIFEDHFDLSPAQWRVMAAIAEEPGITARRVAERTPLDKVAISRAVTKLIEKSLVTRNASAEDGRVSHLELTRKGNDIYAVIAPQAIDYERKLLAPLDSGEIASLERILPKLLHAARTISVG